jgi:tetratricopeptide (TPR) repeat protein
MPPRELLHLNRYEEALEDFTRSINLEPTAWSFQQRGVTYWLMRKNEDALKDFNEAIKLGGECNGTMCARGFLYLQMNQAEKAIEDFDRSIQIDPEFDWVYIFRGLAKLRLNQMEAAEADFHHTIAPLQAKYEEDPTDWSNTFNLALYHLTAENQEESDRLYTTNLTAPKEWLEMAISDLDDFLHLFPDHSQAQQVRSMLQEAIV